MSRTSHFLVCVSALSLTGFPAFAREGDDNGQAVKHAVPQVANVQGADQAVTGVDDIVVTAQRRQERLLDVPMSVTALSGSDLDRSAALKTQDLTTVVPGLLWARSTINSQPTIRGIGSRNASPGDESNVASFLDGVYQPDQSGLLQEFANVERVEVLKGPQGTLFGRNATGGAINIVTKPPSFTPTGSISATYGSFDYYKLTGFISTPIVADVLAVSLSGVAFGDGGYIDNVYLNTKQGKSGGIGVRGKILLKLPRLKLALNEYYVDSNSNIGGSGRPVGGNSQIRTTANPNKIPLAILIPAGDFQTSSAFVPIQKSRQSLIDFHWDYDLDFATLSGLVSYGHSRADADALSEMSPLALSRTRYSITDNYFNEELSLTSASSGPVTWLVGGNAFQANVSQPQTSITPTSSSSIDQRVRTRAFAAFAELTWRPVDKLFLTGGLRYSWDSKEDYLFQYSNSVSAQGKASWSKISPRAVVRYELAPSTNIYVSYTSGYKSGAFTPNTVAGAQNPAQPETVNAYEAGVKTRIGSIATLSLAAFHYSYRNLQTTAFVTINGGSFSLLQNAPSARVNGIELNGDFTPAPNLRLYFAVSLLNTRIGNFPNATVQSARTTNGIPNLSGNVSVVTNVLGKHLIRAPDSTITVGGNYTVPLSKGSISLDVNAFFSDKYYHDLLNRVAQPAYEVVNATITWNITDNYKLGVFAQNLTNSRYTSTMLITGFGDLETLQKPRWFGVTAGAKF